MLGSAWGSKLRVQCPYLLLASPVMLSPGQTAQAAEPPRPAQVPTCPLPAAPGGAPLTLAEDH